MLADNVLGSEIVFKISYLPSKLRFSVKYSFFGQSLGHGHYQPTYQPPEGVYLLNIFAPNGGYCVYYPSNLFRNERCFENWGISSDIPQF